MSSLGEMLTEQEIDLMMGEAGADDGKVVMSMMVMVMMMWLMVVMGMMVMVVMRLLTFMMGGQCMMGYQ